MQIWPFNRDKDQNTDVTKEVQDYYQAEKRERVGIAGLLAVGTLLVTIALALGLFFGGRWAYRAIFSDNDDNTPETTQQSDDGEEAGIDQPRPDSTDDEADQPVVTPPEPVSPPAPNPSATDGSRPRPNTSGDLPNTGPADTARLVFSTVVLASTGYYLLGDKKRASK